MKTYQLVFRQTIPVSIDRAWDFFSDPRNLNDITPDSMRFRILDPERLTRAYPGMIIRYKVSPLLGIPLNWVTEITQVKEKEFFIDDQRVGPYRLWHHQHLFKPVEGGVEMTDILTYALPFGFVGRIAGWLFLHRKVRGIFAYRHRVLARLFT